MANSEAGTSGEAAQALGGEYQVFLSFRGPDTRHGFADFLYHGLLDAGVHVFRDEEELRIGKVIGRNLLCAINNSMIYIPIFSRTYASSKWCLRELACIVDNVSKLKGQKSILPIFLDVEPEDVKLKTPLYSTAFEKHKEDFPKEVEAWKKALAEVGGIKGWNVGKNQSQATIIKLVVKKVLEKLELKQKSVTEHLVGLDDRVKHLTGLLNVNHPDVQLIGIYGMGGIGKTTVAKVVFNELSSHFGKHCSFLENVRESVSTKDSIVQLQKKLLFDIVDSESAEGVKDSEQGMKKIGETLSTTKVLVVLDDLDNKEHIEKLIGNYSLHSGSRIIITTRDMAILQVEGLKGEIIRYEMLKMDYGLALQLFCRHAFGRDFPSDDYQELSSEIVSSTGGLPLALEVIGSLLNQKNKAFWEETLGRLKNVPEKEILKKLRISYDDLDEYQKQIFLDIACFLFNESKTNAICMWKDCQFYPERGIDALTSKCLIKILDNDKFWMHDQLKDMGRQIVRQESTSDLSKRSRLWIAKEALEIIRTEERKNKVQALEIFGRNGSIEITNEEFERLPNLRFLNLGNGTFAGDFAKCHSKLRWISWHSPHGDFRAKNMYLDHLVVFKLDRSHFTDDSKAWDLIKMARKLKVLSLTECDGIMIIPDFSKCLGLERLTLAHCNNLKKIESFIRELQSLIKLEINQCKGLTYLPKEVGKLVKLKHFSLHGCSELRELPDSLRNLTSLIELDLSHTRIRELPNSIGELKSLRVLRFAIVSYRETHVWQLPSGISTLVNLEGLDLFLRNKMIGEVHVWQLPSGISTLVNLEELDLSGHDEMIGEIPIGIGELSSLRILNLECTSICGIPRTINMLHKLQTLNLMKCHSIQVLPELPTSLTCLLLKSKSLISVPNLSNLTNLVELQLEDGSRWTEESNLHTGCDLWWIWKLRRLRVLRLDLPNVPAPQLAYLSHLEELTLCRLDLEKIGQLPSSLLRLNLEFSSIRWAELLPLTNLSTLKFDWCEVEDIPLEGLPRLEKLTVRSCKRLQRLSIPSGLKELRQGEVSNCPELVEIRVVGLSKSLERFIVSNCESLRSIGGLPYLKNLEKLEITCCKALPYVEGLNELESLKFLLVCVHPSLRSSIDASCKQIPDDCVVHIFGCGNSIKDVYSPSGIPLKLYEQEILLNTSNKMGHPFTIRFHLGVKKQGEAFKFVGGIKREIEDVNSDSVSYEGLIANVKGFGFRLKRMWYETTGTYYDLLVEIKSDEQVKGMVQIASKRGSIDLYVEGGVDSEWKGDYDDEMMEMLEEEWAMKAHVCFDEDGAERDVSSPDEDSDSASVGESETDGTSSIDDFQSEPGNVECFEATGNRRQMSDERIGHSGNVNEGETTSMENRKEEKDESGEPANQNDFVWSSCQRCEGVEDHKSSCEATTEVEDEGDLSSVKRDRIVDTERIPTKTGRGSGTRRASNQGRDLAERGRGRGTTSSSRNSRGSRSGTDTVSTSGKGTTSNSGRSMSLISRSSANLSSGRGRGSISGKGTSLSSGYGRGSSSKRGTTNMGASSSSGRSIVSSSRSSSTLSTVRSRGSTSGKDATLSLGRSTTKLGLSLRSGADKGSSSPRSSATLSIGRGKGSTSGKGATVNLERSTTLSLERGTTEMGASIRSRTDKGSSSAKTETQTSSS